MSIKGLRDRPVKESFSLVEQYTEEKDRQCEKHNEITADVIEKVESIEKKVNNLDKQIGIMKYGIFIMILNIIATLVSIFKPAVPAIK